MDDDLKKYVVPAWCPQCSFPMKGKSTQTYYKYGVCITCCIEFVEGREERWLAGWRPSEEQLKVYLQKIS